MSDSQRWLVSWSNYYDSTVANAHEAVAIALGDLEDAIKNVGEGTNVFVVEDTHTGHVSIITSDNALQTMRNTTIINVDQSVNISPTINVYSGDN